ncbi:glucuronate isomerase [uncultured Algibacter sp.]|uniref:glucuronate isomerase n=1 Tax=uncultured Algibacter sp. TaxID=298659 RepID=UPI00262BAA34|nr:glucuronate isomerase [uncultured Algibacter sp.]
MSVINSGTFITEDFLLESDIAKTLYHDYAEDLPIIDYHNHLSAQLISENNPVKNITEAWLKEDHYKWRGMRANGIEEQFITGNASLEDKFIKWAETVPYTLRNPLFHWTQLELKRYFGINDILQPRTAAFIYKKANTFLANQTPAQLLEQMKVEVVCTTDDPVDSLEYHQQIANQNFYTKVYPTFRSDNLFFIQQDTFKVYLEKLEKAVSFSISSFSEFIRAIDSRIDFFHRNGCRLSDYGVSGAFTIVDYKTHEVSEIFNKFLNGETLSLEEIDKYKSAICIHLAKKYHEKKWVQQYHLGPLRNNNKRLQKLFGADAGCDSIGDYSLADSMSKLFNQLDESNQLAKTITYNLNPSQNEVFCTMMGNFNNADTPGKMQWGAAWWFLDQKDGMEKQINTLSNLGLLSRFVGMLTDSRSFLSFPRHEYFRRILCNMIAQDVHKGLVPNDLEFLGKMIQDICYNNAVNYFKFD